jgi:hypothetical protein
MNQIITSRDSLQPNYTYLPVELPGRNFNPEFKPELSPQKMLELGIFGGAYFEGNTEEYPIEWFTDAQMSDKPNPKLNFFGVEASQPLQVWQQKGWIYPEDPRGWFQWYCRYYLGRRVAGEDERQIKRWKAFARHIGQIKANCMAGDINCRPRQRQALLHWAYDSRNL